MLAQKLMIVAIAVIFIGTILLIISSIIASQQSKSKIDVGFGGFIGPFPFGFFSSKKAFWMWFALATLTIVIFVIWLITKMK